MNRSSHPSAESLSKLNKSSTGIVISPSLLILGASPDAPSKNPCHYLFISTTQLQKIIPEELPRNGIENEKFGRYGSRLAAS